MTPFEKFCWNMGFILGFFVASVVFVGLYEIASK